MVRTTDWFSAGWIHSFFLFIIFSSRLLLNLSKSCCSLGLHGHHAHNSSFLFAFCRWLMAIFRVIFSRSLSAAFLIYRTTLFKLPGFVSNFFVAMSPLSATRHVRNRINSSIHLSIHFHFQVWMIYCHDFIEM